MNRNESRLSQAKNMLPKVVVFSASVFLLVGCKSIWVGKSKPASRPANTSTPTAKTDSGGSPYEGLRSLAMGMKRDSLELQNQGGETGVYGVVMDWNMGEGIATVVAFSSGDASLYLSTGGGVIGGRGHDHVRKAAINLIHTAEGYLGKAVQTESTPLPEKGVVKFYFLTDGGKFVCEEQMENFENNSSRFLRLFEDANEVLTAIRATSDMK